MRISDWSSDVCSSDLPSISPRNSFAATIRTITSGPCSVAISAACSPKSGGKTMNKGLLTAASMVAVIAAMPAQAQDAAAIEAAGEIVVTAQKREQRLIDVPQSVSVVSGEALENIQATNFSDYLKLVPGLQLNQTTPGFGRLVLRGVNTGGVASTVAVYRSEEHTSELQSLMRISYAVFCLKKKNKYSKP